MITGAMRTTTTGVLQMLLDLPTLRMVVESTNADGSIPPTEARYEKPRNRTQSDLSKSR